MTDASGTIIQKTAEKAGGMRWTIVSLLFFATTINYIDRTMLGILAPGLGKELGWGENDYGNIVTAFQAAYAIGFLIFGRIIDIFGPRIGYTIAIVIWTIGHMAHGFASTVGHFMMSRIVLGLGEAGHFPSAVRASSEWFPQKERSFAIGWINSGTTIGVILTTPVVWFFMTFLGLGWRETFLWTGIFGVVLLVLWWTLYRNPRENPKVSEGELAWIEHDPAEKTEPTPWLKLAATKEAWAYSVAKFLTDPVWFFLLFWLPKYFNSTYNLDIKTFLLPMIAIYLISDAGSIAGGWLSSKLIASGRTPSFARKVTMLVAGCFVLPMLLLSGVNNVWLSVLIIGLAAGGHQAFSANLLSLPGDLFPKRAVGSVIGMGGFLGGVGGMIMAKSTGMVLQATGGNYTAIFATCTVVYFVALVIVHTLSPKLERATLS
jgi:MFS transporter, ACS family, hexuronate transporter